MHITSIPPELFYKEQTGCNMEIMYIMHHFILNPLDLDPAIITKSNKNSTKKMTFQVTVMNAAMHLKIYDYFVISKDQYSEVF